MPIFIFFIALLSASYSQALSLAMPEGAALRTENTQAEGLYRLPLGRARTVNGRWQFEKVIWLKGQRHESNWSLDNRENYTNIANYFIQAIKQSKARVLFQCQGLACGASNIWANDFFQNWHLYGPDAAQYYWALQEGNQYLMVYLIERGNQQINLHIQRIESQDNHTTENISLNKQCDNKNLASSLTHNPQQQWLLLVSVMNDKNQSQSLAKGQQCIKQLKQRWPDLKIQLLALGQFNLQLERVTQDNIELRSLN